MCGDEGSFFHLRQADPNPWNLKHVGQISRLRGLDKYPWKCYRICLIRYIIIIECRQICREYGKIDQNSSWNLLTNMDQYALNLGLTLRCIIWYRFITYVYLTIYNYSIWYAIYSINSPLCSTLLHYISLLRAIWDWRNGRGI